MRNKVRFLHSSDLQLGMKRHFLGEAQIRYDEARTDSIIRLGDAAEEEGCEFIVLAGDVFEGNSVSEQAYVQAADAFHEVSIPIYVLSGNHDYLAEGGILQRLSSEVSNVHLLENSQPVRVRPGVEIVGAPLRVRKIQEDLLQKALQNLEPTDGVRILVGHGQFQGYGHAENQICYDLEQLENKLEQGYFSYCAMGDTHSAQAIGETGKIWFSGSPEVTDFYKLPAKKGEVNSGQSLIVTIDANDPTQVEVKQHKIGQWKFLEFSAELRTDEDLEEYLRELGRIREKKRTVIKTKLGGRLSLMQQQELRKAEAELSQRFASYFPSKSSPKIQVKPTEEDIENLDLPQYVAKAYRELCERSATDPAAKEAIFQLYELLDPQ